MRHALMSFTATTVISSFTCEVSRDMGFLSLHYVLRGDVAQIDWPPPTAIPNRRGQLWEETCFEAFLRRSGEHAYIETNASPSGDWHCYRFKDYRADMQMASAPTLQVQKCAINATQAEILVQIDLNDWLTPPATLQLGLAAVIQTKTRARLHYALKHVDDKPDFHHRDNQTLLISWDQP
ncbi:MAG: hypothetical protein ACJARY_000337 [Candidatus Azotimanducaceae bacterium]|jgi:hypothetical protein